MVDLADGKQIKLHQDQIWKRFSVSKIPLVPQSVEMSSSEEAANTSLARQELDLPKEAQEQTDSLSQDAEFVKPTQLKHRYPMRVRYPARVRCPPDTC